MVVYCYRCFCCLRQICRRLKPVTCLLLPLMTAMAVRNRQQQATVSGAGPTNPDRFYVRSAQASIHRLDIAYRIELSYDGVGLYGAREMYGSLLRWIMEWRIVLLCGLMELYDWLRAVSVSSCSYWLGWLLLIMSVFRKVLRWPWKKIIKVVVVIVREVLDELAADPPKKNKG